MNVPNLYVWTYTMSSGCCYVTRYIRNEWCYEIQVGQLSAEKVYFLLLIFNLC